MSDLRAVLVVAGLMLLALAAAMGAPLLMEAASGGADAGAFGVAMLITGFCGGVLVLIARGPVEHLSVRGAFLVTTLSWLALTAFAAIPFALAQMPLSVTDAVFESMSGLTTTGSTVIMDLEAQSAGVLLWRAILQWIGGVGIVVTAIAVLPLLRVGGMQLFRMESSDTSEKMLPRATEIAGAITSIYVALTALCAFTYLALGMPAFDAVAHAMTTIATGGFSTKNASMGAFTDTGADIAAVVFMLAGALPFGLYMLAMRGQTLRALRDSQARAFLATALILTLFMTVYLVATGAAGDLGPLRAAAFNVVSVLTGTGYATANYALWGAPAAAFFFLLTFVGGCAGSTACGIKIFRFQVAGAAILTQARRMARPHAVVRLRFDGRVLPDETIRSVLSFMYVYLTLYATFAMILALLGLDTVLALSAAATAISNVGPALGPTVGPAGTFAPLPDAAKWVLAAAMLIGRLEVFAVLVLFSPRFWRS